MVNKILYPPGNGYISDLGKFGKSSFVKSDFFGEDDMLVSGKLDISYLVYIARMFKTLDLDYKFSDDTSGQNLNCDCGVLSGAGTHNRSIFLPSNHQQVAFKGIATELSHIYSIP